MMIIVNFIIIIVVIIKIIFFLNEGDCSNWVKRINGTYINNSEIFDSCFMKIPKMCKIDVYLNFIDTSKVFLNDCKSDKRKNIEYEFFLSNLKIPTEYKNMSKMKHFGYPITTGPDYDIKIIRNSLNLREAVRKNIIPMDNFIKLKKKYKNLKKPEVELIFDKNNIGKIYINVNKNETLSKERLEISKKSRSFFENVIIVFIDAISRQHFLRSFRKTIKFLKTFTQYKNNKGVYTFEFLKYHTFRPYTHSNAIPMFYGKPYGLGEGINIIKNYKEKGYITAFSGSYGDKEIFEIDMSNKIYERMEFDSFDHENIAMYLDSNYLSGHGPDSITRRCLYQKDVYEYNFMYGNDFFEKYKNNKKLLRLYFLDAHEATYQIVKFLDAPLCDYLKNLYKKKYLQESAVFIVSDHGLHFPNLFYLMLSEDTSIEKNNGLLFILLPNKSKTYINYDLIYENLRQNSEVMITPYDIYFTFLHILEDYELEIDKKYYNKTGISLFKNISGKNRNCQKYLELKENYCICIPIEKNLSK